MRTAAAWSFPCGGCFLWTGRRVAAPSIRCALLAYRWPRPQQLLAASAAGGARRRCSRLRCCSNPPAYVSLTFAQKKTASVSLHQRFFHGRGWITQAALLKTAHWAVFALSSATAPQLFESTLGYALKSFGQKKNSSIFTTLEFLVGAGGFEPPKLKSSRFTVCPHWPLGNTPIFFSCPLPDDLLSLS